MATLAGKLACLLLLMRPAAAVDRTKFRTCHDTGFCRRYRAPESPPPKFKVLKESVTSHGLGGVSALLQGEQLDSPPLRLNVKFYDSGVARMQVRLIGMYICRERKRVATTRGELRRTGCSPVLKYIHTLSSLSSPQPPSPPLSLSLSLIQIREANPAKARWEAPDIVLDEKLTPAGHRLLDSNDEASAASAMRIE